MQTVKKQDAQNKSNENKKIKLRHRIKIIKKLITHNDEFKKNSYNQFSLFSLSV